MYKIKRIYQNQSRDMESPGFSRGRNAHGCRPTVALLKESEGLHVNLKNRGGLVKYLQNDSKRCTMTHTKPN